MSLLVAHGLSNAESAAQLVISEATVRTQVARVLTKLGARPHPGVLLTYESGLV